VYDSIVAVPKPHVVILGNKADEHALAVVDAIGNRAEVSLIDASSLQRGEWLWAHGLLCGLGSGWSRPVRGWLRRLAPPGWHHGVGIGSLEAIEAQAALHLLAAAGDGECGTQWLSDYWATMRAENKLVQYEVAQALGLRVPTTRVAACPDELTVLGNSFVVKPLGLGAYVDKGQAVAVHARLVACDDEALDGLAKAPYIAQARVEATRHLRIPTVRDAAWPCLLEAEGLPLDWRIDDNAHTSWVPTDEYDRVGADAIRLACALGLGYSCQDWIVDQQGHAWLVDVNPGGQWLFLPSEVSDPVTTSIADWLVSA
jgi:hypothetical protein